MIYDICVCIYIYIYCIYIYTRVIRILKSVLSPPCLSCCLGRTVQVTMRVEGEIIHNVHFAPNWFAELSIILQDCNIYTRVCWLKAIAGAWCTSVRMHHDVIRPCIFGCVDAYDEITHYFACPCLWQFARETLKLQENSISVGARLCLSEPSFDKLSLLAFCHTLYHTCIHDPECTSQDGEVLASVIVQDRATQLARNVKHLIRVS